MWRQSAERFSHTVCCITVAMRTSKALYGIWSPQVKMERPRHWAITLVTTRARAHIHTHTHTHAHTAIQISMLCIALAVLYLRAYSLFRIKQTNLRFLLAPTHIKAILLFLFRFCYRNKSRASSAKFKTMCPMHWFFLPSYNALILIARSMVDPKPLEPIGCCRYPIFAPHRLPRVFVSSWDELA